jgi:hypothetical protein
MVAKTKRPAWPFSTQSSTQKTGDEGQGRPPAQSSRPYGSSGIQRVVSYSGGAHVLPRDRQLSGVTGGGSHPLNSIGVSVGGRVGGVGLGRSN